MKIFKKQHIIQKKSTRHSQKRMGFARGTLVFPPFRTLGHKVAHKVSTKPPRKAQGAPNGTPKDIEKVWKWIPKADQS